MVYLLDGVSGTVASEEHRMLAEEIYHRYPNLRFAQIPHGNREGEQYPFAIRDSDTGEIVKELTVHQANRHYVMRWLWENDSQRVDTWAKFQAEREAAKKAQLDAVSDEQEEKLEFVSSVLKSPLHTYKHNGKVIGSGYTGEY